MISFLLCITSLVQAAEAPAVRSILRLVDGTTLRVPARATEDGFVVQQGGAWRPLAAADVVWARAERETLAEARARLEAVHPRVFAARVEVCRWMIDTGLDGEAVTELDRILRLLPDERRALALITMHPPCVDLGIGRTDSLPPDTLRVELVRAGARACNIGASPTIRELIVRELSGIASAERALEKPPAQTLCDELAAELNSGVTTRRTFAAHALRRLYPGDQIGPLAVRAVLDSSLDVRDGAILALRDARAPAACGAVVQALANPNGLVRARAAEALGGMGYMEAVEPLIQLMLAAAPSSSGGGGPVRANLYSGLQTAYVQDYDLEIAQGASVANPIVAILTSGVVFDVGVAGTSSVPITTETWNATRSLMRLTGERLGVDAQAWKQWWDQNRARLLPPPKRTPATGTSGS
ncbi:MAG: HEAT repeat domain-containing protein [Planctomycetes bacterium]|nr:HEAT repeat domain-containing protein [Planctomycetota bacterium]